MPETQAGGHSYALGRNYAASTRLTLQHYLIKDVLGFNLHPLIVETLSPNVRIADIATGNGLWLFDLSKELPETTSLEGFDVSLEQCPPKKWMHSNIQMREWDMYTEPPVEIQGVYDVVHIRFIGLAIQKGDPAIAIANVQKLLKPGGWFQWVEIDDRASYVAKTDASLPTPAFDQLIHFTHSRQNEIWPDKSKYEIPSLLERLGFQDIAQHDFVYRYAEDMTRVLFSSDNWINTCQEFASIAYRSQPDQAEEVYAILSEAAQESRKGAGIIKPPFVFTARTSA